MISGLTFIGLGLYFTFASLEGNSVRSTDNIIETLGHCQRNQAKISAGFSSRLAAAEFDDDGIDSHLIISFDRRQMNQS